MDRRRGRIRVRDQDDGIPRGLVDVIAQVAVVEAALGLREDP